jgi:hypothetical protein
MTRSEAQIFGELSALAALITNNKNCKTQIFIEYAGHINEIDIRVFLDGWGINKNPTFTFRGYLTNDSFTVQKLRECKHQLIKIARGAKINFDSFPYEIEEVKHYKLA